MYDTRCSDLRHAISLIRDTFYVDVLSFEGLIGIMDIRRAKPESTAQAEPVKYRVYRTPINTAWVHVTVQQKQTTKTIPVQRYDYYARPSKTPPPLIHSRSALSLSATAGSTR